MLPSPQAQSTAAQGLFDTLPSVMVLLFRAGPCLEQLLPRPGLAPGLVARLDAEERAPEMRTPQLLRSDQEGNPTWGQQKYKRRLDAEFSMTQTLNNYSFASQFRLAKSVTNGKQAHSSVRPIYKQHSRPPIPALAWHSARLFPAASEPCPVQELRCWGSFPCPRAHGCHAVSPCRARHTFAEPELKEIPRPASIAWAKPSLLLHSRCCG